MPSQRYRKSRDCKHEDCQPYGCRCRAPAPPRPEAVKLQLEVVGRPGLRIAQNSIGIIDVLRPPLGLFVAEVQIGMNEFYQ